MNNQNLLEHIKHEYSSFSKGQKVIANFIIDNYDKAAYMTAGAISKKTGVSESTVVRFASTLGYDGFPKLQKHLQELIKNKLTTVQRLNIMEGKDPASIIDTVLKMEINNLKSTRENIDIGAINKIVDLIIGAKKIYIIGFRSSAPLAQVLVYYLGYMIDSAELVSFGVADVFTQMIHISSDDVVIGIAFPRYSTQTIKGLKFARSRGAKIIGITDNATSPLYELADVSVLTKSDMNSFVDSLVAPLSIINALIIMVGLKCKDSLLKNFGNLESLWRENNIYERQDMDFTPTEDEE